MPNKIFDQVEFQKPRMSAFDLSREQKLSCNMGELIPTYLEEIVPGDQFRVDTEIMMRLAPMLAPVMHRVNVYMHYFFVPNRIIWSQWEDFITGGQEGTSDPNMPIFTIDSGSGNSRLADYLGIPQHAGGDVSSSVDVHTLPFAAYQAIWNEYYRDPNLHDELDVDADTMAISELDDLRNRCWEKDYLTSALPWTQRGEAASAPISSAYKDVSEVKMEDGSDATGDAPLLANLGELFADEDGDNIADAGEGARIENLADAAGILINDLRSSSALQRFLEKSARGGYRYIEQILSHFGVRSSDQRLQRPEYLGGGKQPIVISEVLNTSATSTEPQGEMAGHGISVGQSNTFQQQFEEHGYVMGIMSVLPKTAYQHGVDRHWTRRDRTDFYWPEFANLGEQEVLNLEVFVEDNDPDKNYDVFGYQQRYAEMKYGKSSVHGEFRDKLDFWHMGRKLTSPVSLNTDFVEAHPTERIFAVQDEDHLWVQLFHKVRARRPMPYFADPRLG